MKLPQLSIASKLYAIFALLATVTVALAAVAVLNAHQHAPVTDSSGAIDHIDWTVWLTNGLAVAAVLLAGVGAFIIWHAIARPLVTIARVTERVAAGTETHVPFEERGDEIGALARSIVVFRDALTRNRELHQQLVAAADSRGQRTEYMSAEIAAFAAGIAITVGELGRLSDQMLAASAQLSGAADQASERTRAASTASADASANVRDIASAADELATSVAEIDRQVAQSTAIAAKAVGETESTNAAVAELAEAAGRIGDVIRLITDVAEQTNLLALNATIEAARAGDAGRGFAVVAGEVKALAGQTAKATQEIGAQIAGMQHATARSIDAIGSIARTIRAIGEISNAIAAAVTEQGAATQEIARSVETAAQRTGDTAGEVERVTEATGATRTSAEAVRAVADDLGKVASGIRREVDAFCQKLRAA